MKNNSKFQRLSLALIAVAMTVPLCPAPCIAQESRLWGKQGELWRADGRLPDFSFAGYRRGELPLPAVEQVTDVTRFGADGTDDLDDTRAFRKAIEATERGAIFVPAGRYVIRDIIEVRKPNVVLRGAGPDRSFLYFPRDLEDVRPNMGQTTTGRPTSNYSWSGGFLWVRGQVASTPLGPIIQPADRGRKTIVVDHAGRVEPDATVRITLRDDDQQSLIDYLYRGDSGSTVKLTPSRRMTEFVARVVSIDGDRVTLDRPLPWEIRTTWQPILGSYGPRVSEVGIEDLGFVFPDRPYAGHFTERGANAIALSGVAHCWVRNVRIHNSDSGIFASGDFCTLEGVVLTSERQRDGQRQSTGHHGLQVTGNDNLVRDFQVQTRFIHDLTVAHCHGNVFCDGRGEDLSLDHHKYAPYANLFTNLDAGAGTQLWKCGGGEALGKHCAAWGTFWNIRADRPLSWPPANFCPQLVNLVGLTTDQPSVLEPEGRWFEAIAPDKLQPANLWKAQRERRRSQSR